MASYNDAIYIKQLESKIGRVTQVKDAGVQRRVSVLSKPPTLFSTIRSSKAYVIHVFYFPYLRIMVLASVFKMPAKHSFATIVSIKFRAAKFRQRLRAADKTVRHIRLRRNCQMDQRVTQYISSLTAP